MLSAVLARNPRRSLQRDVRSFESLESRILLTGTTCEPVITQTGSMIIAVGTAMDDDVELFLGEQTHVLNFSGFQYTYDASEITDFRIGGATGNNSIRIVGSGLDDDGRVFGVRGTVWSDAYDARSFSFQETTIVGGGGTDYGRIFGSNNDDRLQGLPEASTLTTPESVLRAEAFERVDTYGRGGNDVGQLFGVQGRDVLVALDEYVSMTSQELSKVVRGFERLDGFGRGGDDFARLFDSSTNDTFVSTPGYGYLRTPNRLSSARGFEEIEAISNQGGFDRTQFFDDALATETFTTTEMLATIASTSYQRSAQDFDQHDARSTGGGDTARLQERTDADIVQSNGIVVQHQGPSRDETLTGFANIEVEPTEFEFFLQSLEPFVPQATIDQLAQQLTASRNLQNGSALADEIIGTASHDEINTLEGNDVVFSMEGNDLVHGGTGNDSLDGNNGNDIAFGDVGNDELKGGSGNDVLLGGQGNDIVDGEGGNDFVSGGAGNDVFRFISLDDMIVISDYDPSQDRIELINIDPEDIRLGTQWNSMTINHPDGLTIALLGVSPALSMGDLNVAYVTGTTQTIFDPS